MRTRRIGRSGFLGEPRVNVLLLNLALEGLASSAMKRGELRIYVGYAAGVGKTFAMLGEGHRRRDRGTDVVVGFVEPHERPLTRERIGDLEVVPRRRIEYRGSVFEEMDVDAILARAPEVALVDELAHTNVPGLSQREALAGRRRAARRRHRRDLDREHPAPRVPE